MDPGVDRRGPLLAALRIRKRQGYGLDQIRSRQDRESGVSGGETDGDADSLIERPRPNRKARTTGLMSAVDRKSTSPAASRALTTNGTLWRCEQTSEQANVDAGHVAPIEPSGWAQHSCPGSAHGTPAACKFRGGINIASRMPMLTIDCPFTAILILERLHAIMSSMSWGIVVSLTRSLGPSPSPPTPLTIREKMWASYDVHHMGW